MQFEWYRGLARLKRLRRVFHILGTFQINCFQTSALQQMVIAVAKYRKPIF